jgi:hypothetical protein
MGVPIDPNLGAAAVGPFTPANDNVPLVEERQITNNRDRVLILRALHRRLEQIYPQSAEAVDIRALIDRLSEVLPARMRL